MKSITQLVAQISHMRDIRNLGKIISAARKRRGELLSQSRKAVKAEQFERFPFKAGDTIYIGHKKNAQELERPSADAPKVLGENMWSAWWARPIKVLRPMPRKKQWIIQCGNQQEVLTPAIAGVLQMSHEVTPESLTDALGIERMAMASVDAMTITRRHLGLSP